MSPRRSRRHARSLTVPALTAVTLAAVTLAAADLAAPVGAAPAAASAKKTSYAVPARGLAVSGHGWGNGIGLSQWGAYGAAAVKHRSARQILAFYYPHTTDHVLSGAHLRVLLASEPATGTAGVAATKGLTVSGAGGTTKLPATAHGRRVAAWRVRGDGGTLRLGARYGGAWHHVATPPLGPAASFRAPSRMLTMQTAAGTRSYRGRLDVTLSDGALVAIDRVGLEGYVAGVVPDEMPPSWPAAALKAQAVAARSYAAYEIAHPRSSRWDAYADSRDQAYGGVTTETSSTDDATRATAGEIRVDRSGQAIFAAYGAADGGETVPGTVAGAPADYLPAQADPYDDLEPNSASAWTATITRSALAGAYPSVGKPRSVTVDARDGRGQWGGRISELTVHGTAGSVRVSGVSFAYSLGLRSPWWAASTKSGASTSGAVLPGGAGTETDGF